MVLSHKKVCVCMCVCVCVQRETKCGKILTTNESEGWVSKYHLLIQLLYVWNYNIEKKRDSSKLGSS